MSNLEQEDVVKALIQLVTLRYLIDDRCHNEELEYLKKIGNTLYYELNDANAKEAFLIWLNKKMEDEKGLD